MSTLKTLLYTSSESNCHEYKWVRACVPVVCLPLPSTGHILSFVWFLAPVGKVEKQSHVYTYCTTEHAKVSPTSSVALETVDLKYLFSPPRSLLPRDGYVYHAGRWPADLLTNRFLTCFHVQPIGSGSWVCTRDCAWVQRRLGMCVCVCVSVCA